MNFTNRSTAVFSTKTTAALGVYKAQGGTVPASVFPRLPTDAHLVVFHLSKAFRLDCFKTMALLLGKSLHYSDRETNLTALTRFLTTLEF